MIPSAPAELAQGVSRVPVTLAIASQQLRAGTMGGGTTGAPAVLPEEGHLYLRDPIYIGGRYGRRQRRASPLRTLVNLAFVACAVGVNYIVFFHDTTEPLVPSVDKAPPSSSAPETDSTRPEAAPEARPAGATEPASPPDATTIVRGFEGKIQSGDTVSHAVEGHGIDPAKISPVLATMQSVFDFKKAKAGHRYSGEIDGKGRILRFTYSTGPMEEYTVRLENDEYVAAKKEVAVDIRTAEVGCAIGSSLFASLTRCGEGPDLAQRISDLFAFDVDFFQEIRPGDIVKIVVEKEFVDGRFSKYGRILAASYEGKFGAHTAFLYKNVQSREGYYAADGRALEKEFLKTPLKYTRISSGFTHHRFHPTLHTWKKHLAIDYAAPVNTPVQAVASGRVSFVGKQSASGNLVVIEHAGGHSSYYAHLNKFGDVKEGDAVTQRSVIGYVGQTGRATGPHLHFAIKKGEKWLNPLEITSLASNPLEDGEKTEFMTAVQPLIEQLSAMRVQGLAERQG
ncbi:MAG: M23 family metallopeptidase [Myxococcales bacterium]|nr:M23 family metallopeptidase [Myxococcales bacterium]